MIEIIKARWCQDAERDLAPALDDDADEIRRQVEAGEAELFLIPGRGWLVTRIEKPAGQPPVLVLVAGAGRDLHAVVDEFKKLAARNRMGRIRAHSSRPGMARMLGAHGFRPVETVYAMEVC